MAQCLDVLIYTDEGIYEKDGQFYGNVSWHRFAVKLGEAFGIYKLIIPILEFKPEPGLVECNEIKAENILPIYPGWDTLAGFFKKIHRFAMNLPKISREIGRARFVIIRGPSFAAFFIFICCKLKKHGNIILYVKNNILESPNSLFVGNIFVRSAARVLARILDLSIKIMIKHSRMTFVCGSGAHSRYCKYNKHVYKVVSSAVSSKEVVKKERKISASGIKILTVGTTRPSKDYESLIEAFSMFNRKYNNSKLTIIGRIEQKHMRPIQDRISACKLDDKVEFLGFIAWEELKKAYYSHDMLVFTSLSEGFPRAIIEAWAFGLPIVSTRFNKYLPELVDGCNAIVVDVKNPHACYEGMCKIMEDDALREKMIATGQKLFLDSYSQEKIVNYILENVGYAKYHSDQAGY
ncbi:MAG TPA: glycosyltransferase family 4 protein [Candidatus Omnitrophota bacterium]|nr:glycosyltransferase family 4 protein [Candidatus Omnitrophota bacterium]